MDSGLCYIIQSNNIGCTSTMMHYNMIHFISNNNFFIPGVDTDTLYAEEYDEEVVEFLLNVEETIIDE